MNQNYKKLQSALLALAVISTMGAMGMGQKPMDLAGLLQQFAGGLGDGIPAEDPGKAIARRFRALRTQVQEAVRCHNDAMLREAHQSVSKAKTTIGGIERLSKNFPLTAAQNAELESLEEKLAMILSMLPTVPTDPIGDGLGAASASAAEGAGAKPEDAPAGVVRTRQDLADIIRQATFCTIAAERCFKGGGLELFGREVRILSAQRLLAESRESGHTLTTDDQRVLDGLEERIRAIDGEPERPRGGGRRRFVRCQHGLRNPNEAAALPAQVPDPALTPEEAYMVEALHARLKELPFFFCDQQLEELAEVFRKLRALRKRPDISDAARKEIDSMLDPEPRHLDTARRNIKSNRNKPEYQLRQDATIMCFFAYTVLNDDEKEEAREEITRVEQQYKVLWNQWKQRRRSREYMNSDLYKAETDTLIKILGEVQANIIEAKERLEIPVE